MSETEIIVKTGDNEDPKSGGSKESSGFFGAGTLSAATFSLMSATLGAGALTMPAAMNFGGYLGLAIVLGLILLASMFSITLIVHAMTYSGMSSMEEMSLKGYGHGFATAYEIVVVLFCFGTALGYLITIFDIYSVIMISILSNSGYQFDEDGNVIDGSSLVKLFTNRAFVITMFTLVVCLPLSLMKRINALRFTSFLGVSAILFLTLTMDVHWAVEGTTTAFDPLRNRAWPVSFKSFFSAFSLAMFAFACQPNVPAIYAEMKKPSVKKMKMVGAVGMSIALGVYVFMALGGFFSFGDGVDSSILKEFQNVFKDWSVNRGLRSMEAIAFGGMSFAVMFAYPLNVFPTRFSVESLVVQYFPHLQAKRERIGLITSLVCVGLTLVLAIFVSKVSMVFDLIGCTAGCGCSLIAPGFLYLRFAPRPSEDVRKFEGSDTLQSQLTMHDLSSSSVAFNTEMAHMTQRRHHESEDGVDRQHSEQGLIEDSPEVTKQTPEFAFDRTIPRVYNQKVKLFRFGAYSLIAFGIIGCILGTLCWVWSVIDDHNNNAKPDDKKINANDQPNYMWDQIHDSRMTWQTNENQGFLIPVVEV
eukprot:GDKJ01013616.1.p1 GENE.GDKJ01013616.1~~GDKJ01013616.1.p1  ORF type:complete len:586 (-),score=116.44 GDKJ01013616.1:238-1995(-)